MIFQIILAFFGSIFPVILFNIDRKKIIWTGFCGALGWASYLLVYSRNPSATLASLAGAFAVGIYSEIMARKLRTPAMEFSIPGIFPLVPGITAYRTVNLLVNQSYSRAFSSGLQTLAVGGAIAFGIMLSATSFRLFVPSAAKKHKKKAIY
ncbi:threonine/serine exporter family protein [Clostridium sp. 19966]|uniref:threonine/serine exporter family protein n=1 Tax=Clostridium sp. 19966 TaxID=2768166 RepID=UPI0028DD89C7|nr:threonine/serine exporter family protein [Clostridium sp. 19966]MDT8719484.1 threonine/serine exporter family protein [Clostridium sp. 19966]